MKKALFISIILFTINNFSQKKKSSKIGNISIDELKLTKYDKDTTANALVLYEHANYYLNEDKENQNTTDYYFKIKILKKEGMDKATVKIPFFGDEKIQHIKGITYNISKQNKIVKSVLTKSQIFTKDLNSKWKEISFTLPNIKVGSVIEYSYSSTSPYSSIDDWYFQSDTPKIKSDFTASILGNWKYKIRLIGFQKLSRNDASVKKKCVYISGLGNGACLVLNYGMDYIPAFKEEDFMLSKENFISKIAFELESFTHPREGIKKYTKTWKDADRSLKLDFLDNQSSKKNYFKKQISYNLLNSTNELEKAKGIFEFIQKHYTWNGKHWPSRKVKVKNAFENKTGNIFDINLSLFNSLQAANIKSNLVLTSTRDKAVPTRLHPIVNDFNYLIVKAVINNKTYFLDATDKQLPFGLIQYNALNGDGRVMDFKKGSYWETIKLNKKTIKKTRVQLTLNEETILNGNLMITTDGYFAINDRKDIETESEETYLENFESEHPNLEVDNFKYKNLNTLNEPLHQIYNVTFDDLNQSNKIRINPFLVKQYTKNPFKLNKRDYPVDFGYPRNETYIISLKLPEKYIIKKLPENKMISLPNKGGRFILNFKKTQNTINVYSKFTINKKVYSSEEYHYLKEFFNQIIKAQDTFIEIEKVND